MQAAAGFFIVDFIFRPFAKIYQKMPSLTFVFITLLYGFIAYLVIKSAFSKQDDRVTY
ncbi:MAG: hypothetical protein J0H83_05935 [Candidatus Melainabacteria bacterium]|jgi:hypothetical protein|nr:hypothetical protein [Candidatus Melainabacteria bacterium]MBX9674253.1 hypothetical protein [Candidatus Obscuribacterales bacterium]